MCFTQPISFVMGAVGTVLAALFYRKFPDRPRLAIGVLYFASMEFIQFVQYFYADKCEDFNNKFWTLIGYLHITFQPLAVAVMTSAFDKDLKDQIKSRFCIMICIWGAVAQWAPVVFGPWYAHGEDVKQCFKSATAIHDWIRSWQLCTLSGETHLAWHVPMARTSYLLPNSFIHFFCMFVQYFLEWRPSAILNGILSLSAGPLLSMWISGSVWEQASIWCYLSMIQITIVCGRYLLPREWTSCCARSSKKKKEKVEEEDNAAPKSDAVYSKHTTTTTTRVSESFNKKVDRQSMRL